jgi:peptidoglycan/LPS O-acetylase OafA/YrhL
VVLALLGAAAVAASFTIVIHVPAFDIPTRVGVFAGGIVLMSLAYAARAGRWKWFARALKATAVCSLLIGYGDAGSTLVPPIQVMTLVATAFTTPGAFLYAMFIRDLARLYLPGPDEPASPSTRRQPLAA